MLIQGILAYYIKPKARI